MEMKKSTKVILVFAGAILVSLLIDKFSGSNNDSNVNPSDRVITVSNIDELNNVLLNKWRGKKVIDFVAEYGEPESKYDRDTYIWEDLVEVDEVGGVFAYDIWMDYEEDYISNFKLGSNNKK
jgi:hypothetical protein